MSGRDYRSDLVDIEVNKVRETEKAWGIEHPDDQMKLVWIPKSQAQLDGKTLTAPEWLLREKGLI